MYCILNMCISQIKYKKSKQQKGTIGNVASGNKYIAFITVIFKTATTSISSASKNKCHAMDVI